MLEFFFICLCESTMHFLPSTYVVMCIDSEKKNVKKLNDFMMYPDILHILYEIILFLSL